MREISRFALGDIVNTDVLQEIQDKFSETTGLAAVIVDAEGKPVTKTSNFTGLCRYIRSKPEGMARCFGCDDRGGRKAIDLRQPVVYRCHSGLTDLAAPIIVQDQYIGAFLAGQVVLYREEGEDVKAGMYKRLADLELDNEVLSDLFDQVKEVQENNIKAAADLIYIMANYIVEIGVVNIVQKTLMQELQAKAELETLLKATELKALQSQVNPHFLFNTLNTIARLAMLEGASQTQEVAYALSDLLRNNLRDMDRLRTVEEEMKSVQDYLTIQKVRFGERVQSSIQIAPEIFAARLPALTLQPLVENAIIHGLEGRIEGGEIRIGGNLYENEVNLEISDTGIGVDEGTIAAIFREEKRRKSQGQTTGLGILNVHKRIRHYFGGQYGVTMQSRLGVGTTISIRFPYQTE